MGKISPKYRARIIDCNGIGPLTHGQLKKARLLMWVTLQKAALLLNTNPTPRLSFQWLTSLNLPLNL